MPDNLSVQYTVCIIKKQFVVNLSQSYIMYIRNKLFIYIFAVNRKPLKTKTYYEKNSIA